MIEAPAYNELTAVSGEREGGYEWGIVSVLRDDRTFMHVLYTDNGCSCGEPGEFFEWNEQERIDLRRRSDVEQKLRRALENLRALNDVDMDRSKTVRLRAREMMNEIYADPVSRALTTRSVNEMDELLRSSDELVTQALLTNPNLPDRYRTVLQVAT